MDKSLQSKDKIGADNRSQKMKTSKGGPGWQSCNTTKGSAKITKGRKMGYD